MTAGLNDLAAGSGLKERAGGSGALKAGLKWNEEAGLKGEEAAGLKREDAAGRDAGSDEERAMVISSTATWFHGKRAGAANGAQLNGRDVVRASISYSGGVEGRSAVADWQVDTPTCGSSGAMDG
jgi:hypothetical protein